MLVTGQNWMNFTTKREIAFISAINTIAGRLVKRRTRGNPTQNVYMNTLGWIFSKVLKTSRGNSYSRGIMQIAQNSAPHVDSPNRHTGDRNWGVSSQGLSPIPTTPESYWCWSEANDADRKHHWASATQVQSGIASRIGPGRTVLNQPE
jgi:hypothetical protein